MSAAVVPIKDLDSVVDPAKLARMADFQLGWFWKIFYMLRTAPHFRLPFDANFWALAGARTKGYWDNHSAIVVSCFKVQAIAGQTWIWSEELVRLAEAGSQLQLNSVVPLSQMIVPQSQPEDEPEKECARHINNLFIQAYNSYPKHVEKLASEKKFLVKAKEFSKQQKIPLIDAAEFIAAKCAEYAECVKRAGIPKQYRPSMARWLNAGRFLDDPSEWAVSYQVNGNGKQSKLQRNLQALQDA